MRSPILAAALILSAPALADEPGLPAADQELGGRVGANLNFAGIGPGGLYFAGSWLYRLTDSVWFDGRAGVTLGGGGENCAFPVLLGPGGSCASSVADGFGVELLAGIRWFVPTQGKLTPWIGGGIGGEIADFSGDDLTGVGIPIWLAGGARYRVSDGVAIGGEADLGFGPVHYGKSIGWEGFLDLKLIFGVDFAL